MDVFVRTERCRFIVFVGFEVQSTGYVQLSITALMESILLWKELAVMHGITSVASNWCWFGSF